MYYCLCLFVCFLSFICLLSYPSESQNKAEDIGHPITDEMSLCFLLHVEIVESENSIK